MPARYVFMRSLALAALAAAAVCARAASPGAATAAAASAASGASAVAVAASPAVASPAAFRMVAPTRQLQSWPLRVFVTRDIAAEAQPMLVLEFGHAVLDESVSHCRLAASEVARHQALPGSSGEKPPREVSGTWLVFRFGKAPAASIAGREPPSCVIPWYKPVVRARPVLVWGDPQTCIDCRVEAPDLVYVGNAPTAIAISLAVLAVFLGTVGALLARSRSSLYGMFVVDGRLSLSRLQMGLWTAAVAFLVLYELCVGLDGREIPASLIALMGASFLTSAASSALDPRGRVPPPPGRSRMLQLLTAEDELADGSKLSLSRLQMLFWTIVFIAMFVAKSLLEGGLWDIPWTLVALMGVSQLGYLGGKVGKAAPQ